MGLFRSTKASPRPPAQEQSRAERYETSVIACNLGRVANLSRTGLRVQSIAQKPPTKGLRFHLEIFSPTDSLTVPVEVVTVTRLGWGRHELGLKFVDIDERTAQSIENLAKFGKVGGSSPESAERRRRAFAAIRMPDYYKVLGLTPSASDAQIQQAFRTLARTYHPDVNTSREAEVRFCEINQSYQVLGDPDRRSEYDNMMGYAA